MKINCFEDFDRTKSYFFSRFFIIKNNLYKLYKYNVLNNYTITKLCKVGKKPLTFCDFMVQ